MNRYFILIVIVLVTFLDVSAQTNRSKSTSKDSVPVIKALFVDSTDLLIEDTLVKLALNGPAYSASNHQNRINELDLKKAKNAWLNLLTISTNYNDQSFAKETPGTTLVYPKYFFGVTIPLGVIISRGTQVRSAKEAVAYSKDQQQILSRSIKASIIGKYRHYKLYNNLLEIQSVLINDVLANALQAEDNFRKGKIAVEAYITAQKTRNEELAKNLNLKYEQELIKIEIEEIIGIPLENILNPKPVPTPATTK